MNDDKEEIKESCDTFQKQHNCPFMKEVGGGMRGERYKCEKCGQGYYLDYDEMK